MVCISEKKTSIIAVQHQVALLTERQCVCRVVQAGPLKIIMLIFMRQAANRLPLATRDPSSLPDQFMSDLWSTG